MKIHARQLSRVGGTTRVWTAEPTAGSDVIPDGAFGALALEHLDALYNHARWLSRSDLDAEELVQETYARALAGAGTFLGGNLKAWLFTILRNTFVDLHRRRRPRSFPGELDGAGGLEATGDSNLFRDDLELDRLRRLVGDEIEVALGSLSEDTRAIVLLDAEGFTETEIAAVVACPVGTVKSRLSRARVLLRQKLKDYARS